jgi:hypothetical protein
LGNEYTSGYQVELVDNGSNKTAAYSVTSTDVKIYGDGNAALSNGTAYVQFDADFVKLLGNVPNVTVTPIGESNGIYIAAIDKNGFTIKENKNGNSNISFNWIAVGKRIDAVTKPELPVDLASNDFDANMKKVMFNESNKEQSATPIWWDGSKLRFDEKPKSMINTGDPLKDTFKSVLQTKGKKKINY